MRNRVVFHLQENSMGKDSIITKPTDKKCKASSMQTSNLCMWMIAGKVHSTTDSIIDRRVNKK